jgi:hypothetical protein
VVLAPEGPEIDTVVLVQVNGKSVIEVDLFGICHCPLTIKEGRHIRAT